MLYQTFIIILLFFAVGSLTSCKTVREVKSIESKGISDPLSDRFIGSSVSKYESGVRHSMDGKRTTTKKIFGGNQQNLLFGGKYNKKSFQGARKNNSSNNQFNPDDYYFAKQRQTTKNQSLLFNKELSDRNKTANEGFKSWFSRGKKVKKNTYSNSKKLISSNAFKQATDAQEKNRNTELEIINPSGTENAPQGMSIDDIRKLLGN